MLEDNIKYKFSDPKLLSLALTHSSLQKNGENNERLEFLGDRVLGLTIADVVFKKFKQEDEGSLAKRHTALVKQDALVVVAKEINLAEYLKLAAGEIKTGGKTKKAILADGVEALIGAMYLDGGFDSAYNFIKNFWTDMMNNQEDPPEDAKSKLQEWAQARALPLPKYTVVSRIGLDHDPRFEIEVSVDTVGSAKATAGSKRQAEKQAAIALLEIIEGK